MFFRPVEYNTYRVHRKTRVSGNSLATEKSPSPISAESQEREKRKEKKEKEKKEKKRNQVVWYLDDYLD